MFRSGLSVLFGFFFSATALFQVSAYDRLGWNKKDLLAGKADLGNDGYTLNRTLGVANFSPEFRMPVQFVYNSVEKHKGLLGDFWTCSQLESRVFPRDKGAEWRTPWGEKISFFEKERITKDTLDLYKEKMKGQGLFSPFSDWEAKGEKGDWRIEGQDKKSGWVFEYKDSYLQKISAPTGRTLVFQYRNKQLLKVEENEFAFIELNYTDKQLDSISINGIKSSLSFSNVKGVVLPEKQGQKPSDKLYTLLSRVQYASLAPEEFSYDDYGYLSGIKRGEFSEKITVVHETLAEREKWLDKVVEAEKLKRAKLLVQEKVTGRILSDKDFSYAYPAKETVSITNKENQTATYNYSGLKGVLKVKDFAGLSSEICYFRRYDVAYNGKLRQIRDAQDRVVLNNRYDKKTGELIRSRDMMDNETYYTYDKNRNLILVSRSEENIDKRPLMAIKYDQKNNPVEYELLDKDGKPVTATKLKYGQNFELTSVETAESYNKFNYNSFGYLTKFTDTFGRVFARNYDKFNRLVSQLSPEGIFVAYSHDANGQIVKIEKYASEKKVELLSSIKFDYNRQGQVISLTDDSGRIKKFDRNEEGKVIAEYFPDNSMVKYSFDKLGRLNEVIDQNGNPIKFSWSKFGKIAGRVTAENQLAQYEYNQYGLTESVEKTLADSYDPAQEIKYSYDEFDRVSRIDYGNGEVKAFKYNNRSKVLSIETFEKEKAAYRTDFTYDEFDRVSKKVISKLSSKELERIVYTYKYTNTGKLLAEKISFPDGTERNIKRSYDKFGRLTEIKDSDKSITYAYDKNSKLLSQSINGVPVTYSYTKLGQLESKVMGDVKSPTATLSYSYTKDGKISARLINGVIQNFEYDARGQLLKVVDLSGNILESYEYDKAGNILKKVINGKTTTFTYDKANQLVSSIQPDGAVKKYAYDAAGRMISETGDAETKNYTYGWLDKVTKFETGATQSTFTYFPTGQLAEKVTSNDTEKFYWDGLALVKRDSTEYTNEPAATGGNPVMTNSEVLFNDMLGNSTGAYGEERFRPINRTSFGEAVGKIDNDINFFTGKPNIEGLGYSFLFRNYRPDLGKWQTTDPIGYPNGWNNLAYVNNKIINYIDFLGCEAVSVVFITDNTTSGDVAAFNADGNFKVIEDVSSPSDLVSKLETYCNETGNTIKTLAVSGHGYGAGVSTQEGDSDPSKNIIIDNFTDSEIQSIKNHLADNASYVSFGCGSGNDSSGLQRTADELGVKAKGFTGTVTSGPNPNYDLPTAIDFVWAWITNGEEPTDPNYQWVIARPTPKPE